MNTTKVLFIIFGLLPNLMSFSQNETKIENDQELFFQTIQTFLDANELAEEAVETFKKGEIPDISGFIEKVNEGIDTGEKVTDSFLNSKDPNLKELYQNYLQSYKLILNIYTEKQDPVLASKTQEEIDDLQSAFFYFLYNNEDLFDNQFDFKETEQEVSNSKSINPKITKEKTRFFFSDILWFIGKVFLVIIPLVLAMNIASIIVAVIGSISISNKVIIMTYLIILYVLFLYLFAFIGAYFHKVYHYYSILFENKWLIYIVSFMGVMALYKTFFNNLNEIRLYLEKKHPSGLQSISQDLPLASTIYIYKGIWMLFISYIIFGFYPSLVNLLYGSIPQYFATLWT
jgi:hypothetical protein